MYQRFHNYMLRKTEVKLIYKCTPTSIKDKRFVNIHPSSIFSGCYFYSELFLKLDETSFRDQCIFLHDSQQLKVGLLNGLTVECLVKAGAKNGFKGHAMAHKLAVPCHTPTGRITLLQSVSHRTFRVIHLDDIPASRPPRAVTPSRPTQMPEL